MRIITLIIAAAFALSAGSAMACPIQNAAKTQTVASSNGNSTPIPARARQGTNG
jgi:hypothetical protein